MKVYKVELMVLDFDGIGAAGIKNELENSNYGNDCIRPKVMHCESRDVGEWYDGHPLNLIGEDEQEYRRLFGTPEDSV